MPNPLVSVRTSTYNHGSYISQCIEGVLSQKTTFDVEYIIGEDYSTDETRQIVFDYGSRYRDRIRVITADRNVGAKGNVYRTRRACRGKYVAICEGDDYWTHPQKLQRQVDMMEREPTLSMCFHLTTTYNERSHVSRIRKPTWHYRRPVIDPRYIIRSNGYFIATCSMLIRHACLQSLPEWAYSGPTSDWTTKLCMASKGPIGFISDVMAVYRKNASNSWSNIEKSKDWHDDHLSKSLEWLESFDEYTQFQFSNEIRANKRKRRACCFANTCQYMSVAERLACISREPYLLISRPVLRSVFQLLMTSK